MSLDESMFRGEEQGEGREYATVLLGREFRNNRSKSVQRDFLERLSLVDETRTFCSSQRW